MRHHLILSATVLSVFIATAALADANVSGREGFSFGPTVSTLGIGGELGYRMNDSFGVRAKAQGFKHTGDSTTDDNINYDYRVKLFTAGAVADYYPLQGGLRLTAGAYYNDNHVSVNNTGNSTTTVGGVTVPVVADTVTGRGDYRRFAPYAGVGYDGNLGAGFELGFDLGVLYQGKADVDVNSNNPVVPTVDLFDVRDDVDDVMDDLRFYPVVGLNLTYRF